MASRKQRDWLRFASAIAAVLACLPLVLAVGGTQRIPTGRPVRGHREVAPLAFSQYAEILGETPAVGSIPAHFNFWNQGDRVVTITSVEASCGCLGPRLLNNKMEYHPGERGGLIVSVKTANEAPGPKSYAVRVAYSDGQPREQVLTLRCTVPEEKVTVHPSEVYFYQLSPKADFRVIRVDDHREKKLKVTDASVSHPLLKVTVGEQEQLEEGGASTPLTLEVAAEAPMQRIVAALVIRTDDPDYPEIKVPVLIQGPTSGTTAPANPGRPEAAPRKAPE